MLARQAMGKWRRRVSLPRRWQRKNLIAKYDAVCYLCHEPFKTLKDITIDHWVPLSKGGLDKLENYRLAHAECNQLKADLTPEDFLAFQQGLIQWNE
jgi:5-methylcytosine-specific restriction endonuclease McrA